MSLLETIFVATLVNVAASFIFFSIQPRIEKLRAVRPRIAHLIGPVLLAASVAIVVGAERLVTTQKFLFKIPVPVVRPSYTAMHSPSLALSAILIVAILANIGFTIFVVEFSTLRTLLIRLADAAFVVAITVLTYKLVIVQTSNQRQALLIMLMSSMLVMLVARMILVRQQFGNRSSTLSLLVTAAALTVATVSFAF